jgi:type VI secretion system secreted protein VgrG
MATASGNADISVLKKFTVAAGEAISLFAQKLGMKLVAASGKLEIQAQQDEMLLMALKDLKIVSVEEPVVVSAAEELWIGAGGLYSRYTAEDTENATRGDILEKCASWDKAAATGMKYGVRRDPGKYQ